MLFLFGVSLKSYTVHLLLDELFALILYGLLQLTVEYLGSLNSIGSGSGQHCCQNGCWIPRTSCLFVQPILVVGYISMPFAQPLIKAVRH
jgi:hypothetical protein